MNLLSSPVFFHTLQISRVLSCSVFLCFLSLSIPLFFCLFLFHFLLFCLPFSVCAFFRLLYSSLSWLAHSLTNSPTHPLSLTHTLSHTVTQSSTLSSAWRRKGLKGIRGRGQEPVLLTFNTPLSIKLRVLTLTGWLVSSHYTFISWCWLRCPRGALIS